MVSVPAMRNVLFVLIILAHDRRRVVHFHITEHPTARWTAQQVVEGCLGRPRRGFLFEAEDDCTAGCSPR